MESAKENTIEFDYRKSLKKRDDSFINKYIRVEKYINRPLAALLVKAVINTRITPNGITLINFLFGIAGAFFLSRGEYHYFVLGGVFTQLSSIIDCADGQLARAKDMCSEYGSHLDLFLDRIMDFALITCMSWGLYTAHNDIRLLLLGLLTAGLYLLQINLFYITNSLLKNQERGATGEARALMLFMVMIFGIAGRLDIFLYLLLAETIIVNLIRIVHFQRLSKKG